MDSSIIGHYVKCKVVCVLSGHIINDSDVETGSVIISVSTDKGYQIVVDLYKIPV